jgi:hypothetical protein
MFAKRKSHLQETNCGNMAHFVLVELAYDDGVVGSHGSVKFATLAIGDGRIFLASSTG